MTLTTWALFCVTEGVLSRTPGPAVLFVGAGAGIALAGNGS